VKSILDIALEYAALGWSVIPLPYREKKPAVKWKEFQATRATKLELTLWFDQRQRNIGLVCGAISGLIVLDVDIGHGGQESLKKYDVPTTPIVQTGSGGFHLYFKHPGHHVGNFAGKLPGFDLRGDGGFVVLPPSVHPNGRQYTWLTAPATALAPAPAWLQEMIKIEEPMVYVPRPLPVNPFRGKPSGSKSYNYAQGILMSLIKDLLDTHEGVRNSMLNRASFLMGKLVGAGEIARSQVENKLIVTGLEMGLSAKEVLATVRSGLDSGEDDPWIFRSPIYLGKVGAHYGLNDS